MWWVVAGVWLLFILTVVFQPVYRIGGWWLDRRASRRNPPHRGPCQCNGCVIRDDDDSVTRWRKAMRRIGVDSPDQS